MLNQQKVPTSVSTFRRSRLNCNLDTSAAFLLLALSFSPAIHAQSPARVQISIPAQSLNQALLQLGQQTDIQIYYLPQTVAGLSAPSVSGKFTADQALRMLLQGTGVQATWNAKTVSLSRPTRSDAAQLEPILVTASADSTTEGTGSYKATGQSTTATGLGLTLRETPQSVSVVTQQQMQDRNMQSLDDVADAATGLTYEKLGTERSYFYSRGFPITDLQIDGVSTSVAESYSSDAMSLNNMAIYDRVEIVRGANGLLQGSGNPSAMINMIRKRPTREFQLSGELGVGSWADYRTQLDVSGPLNTEGTLRGRTVVFLNDANGFKTGTGTKNQLIYAIGEADLGPSTTLTFGAMAQKDDHKGYDWGGLNTKVDGSFYDLPRSTSLAGPWAYLNRDNTTVFGDITHHFGHNWSVTGAINAQRADTRFLASYPSRVEGDTYSLSAVGTNYKDEQLSFNLKANGPFTLFGREHELMLGASSRRDHFSYDVFTATNAPTVDITDFDYGSIPEPILNPQGSNYSLIRREKGVVAATRLNVSDDLKVILGSRLSWSDYASNSPYTNASFESGRQFVPYAGIVYDLSRHHSVYVSYTDIYSIQQYYSPSGLLKPVRGKNYEAGIKSDFFNGQLNTALAIFQTDQLNLPVAMDIASTCGLSGASRCYSEGAKVRNRGIDIEVSGAPSPGWNVAAGFTYSDPEYIAGPNNGQDYNTTIPRKVLKLSTDYQLPGGKWRVGGSIQAQSGMHYEGSTFDISQGGYALVNLHASYRFNRRFSIHFNVRNALDKHYYQSIPSNNNYGGLYAGEPRSFAATLRFAY